MEGFTVSFSAMDKTAIFGSPFFRAKVGSSTPCAHFDGPRKDFFTALRAMKPEHQVPWGKNGEWMPMGSSHVLVQQDGFNTRSSYSMSMCPSEVSWECVGLQQLP